MTDDQLIEQSIETVKAEGHCIMIPSEDITIQQIERITSKLQNDGRFILDLTPINKYWIIRINPAHKKPTFFSKNPTLEKLIIAILGALFSLIVGLLLIQVKERSQSLIDNRQDSTISHEKLRLDSVQANIKDYGRHFLKDTSLSKQ